MIVRLPQFFAKKHRCKDCGVGLASYEELLSHAKREHKRHIMKCKECNKEFVYESDRWKHIKEVHRK